MDRQTIIDRMKQFPFWYHKIKLCEDVVTPGRDFDDIWALIRTVRRRIEYSGKVVLDLGAWDGMWSFEAEALGAGIVVALDCAYEPLRNFLFCRDALNSQAIPYYNVNMYALQDGLDVFLNDNRFIDERLDIPRLNVEGLSRTDRRFDIVQHMGILYHMRDPLMSLIQTRSVMKTGGRLLLETAYVRNNQIPMMVFNGPLQNRGRIYHDHTSWWAPNIECIKEMLYASLFRVDNGTIETIAGDNEVSRMCLIAEAVGRESVDEQLWREVTRRFRNSGPMLTGM